MKGNEKLSLEANYNNAVNAYINEFAIKYEIDFDGWVADRVGEVANFGDYFFSFEQIKYCIDKDVKFDVLIDWQDFAMEHKDNYINLDSYCRLRADFDYKKGFSSDKFNDYLIGLRKK